MKPSLAAQPRVESALAACNGASFEQHAGGVPMAISLGVMVALYVCIAGVPLVQCYVLH